MSRNTGPTGLPVHMPYGCFKATDPFNPPVTLCIPCAYCGRVKALVGWQPGDEYVCSYCQDGFRWKNLENRIATLEARLSQAGL